MGSRLFIRLFADLLKIAAGTMLLSLSSGCVNKSVHEQDLRLLDQAMADSDYYIELKEAKINNLKNQLAGSESPEEIYRINKQLFMEYADLDADSARGYVARNIMLAEQLGKQDETLVWEFERISMLLNEGRIREAEKALGDIDRDTLDGNGKKMYYTRMMYLLYAYSQYMKDFGSDGDHESHYFPKATAYRDSTLKYVNPGDIEYLNMQAWQALDWQDTDSLRAVVEKKLETSTLDNTGDAVSAYTLAQICREAGDNDRFAHYLILSCICYIRSGSKNYLSESLQTLSSLLLGEGDVNRAYKYINYCANNLNDFNNRSQLGRIASLRNRIGESYLKGERRHFRLTAVLLAIGVILIAVLLYMAFSLKKQRNRLHLSNVRFEEANAGLQKCLGENEELTERLNRRNAALEDLNGKLTDANDRLEHINNELVESNTAKEKYLGYVFSMSGCFVDIIDDQRKRVVKMLRTGTNREEIIDHLSSSAVLQKELKSLYKGFDETFLALYPDFVESLNKFMKPGHEIKVRGSNKLTTELRILAAMRLGITDSNRIAEFMHCSVQSVYNSRRSVYARLSISPKQLKEILPSIS